MPWLKITEHSLVIILPSKFILALISYDLTDFQRYTEVPQTPLFTSSILNEDAEILEDTKV